MTDRELNEKIRLAYTHAAPDILEAVLSDCAEQKGSEIKMTNHSNIKKNRRWIVRAAGLAACLCLVLGGILGFRSYRVNHTVDATVSLDVNPSVEILVNKKERVLEVNPLNDDGKVIVGDMDFSGSDVDVAVNAMIGSMLKNGYLNELANSILISVNNDDSNRGAALQVRLTAEVNELLQTEAFSGAVLSQTVMENKDLKQLADDNGITVGKAQLIQDVLAEKPTHTFEELAPLTINELNLLLRAEASGSAGAAGRIESSGTASAKAYIGEAKAKEIALAEAGVSAADISAYEIEMDTSDGVMVYEIEFKSNGYEYDYEINAATGAVLQSDREADDDQPAKPATPTKSTQTATTVIGDSKAREIALKHAGVTLANVTQYQSKLDSEDGVKVYEIEFKSNGYEYDYEINATTGAVLQSDREADDDQPAKPATPTKPTQTATTVIGDSKAREIALKHAGVTLANVTQYQSKLDSEDGVKVYEIEFKCNGYEYDYEINATTGAVLQSDREADDDQPAKPATPTKPTQTATTVIGDSKAREIALKHAGVTLANVTQYQSKLDSEDGVKVYEIEFKSNGYEYDYEINATTGAVLQSDREADD